MCAFFEETSHIHELTAALQTILKPDGRGLNHVLRSSSIILALVIAFPIRVPLVTAASFDSHASLVVPTVMFFAAVLLGIEEVSVWIAGHVVGLHAVVHATFIFPFPIRVEEPGNTGFRN